MHTNIFLVAGIIAAIFAVGKFMQMKFFDNIKSDKKGGTDSVPMKIIVRDTIIAFSSAILGQLLVDQVEPMLDDVQQHAAAFVDNPSF